MANMSNENKPSAAAMKAARIIAQKVSSGLVDSGSKMAQLADLLYRPAAELELALIIDAELSAERKAADAMAKKLQDVKAACMYHGFSDIPRQIDVTLAAYEAARKGEAERRWMMTNGKSKCNFSRNFRAHASIYRRMASGVDCDFSESALLAAFEYETYGKDDTKKLRGIMEGIFSDGEMANGYVFGKSRLNLTINMVKEDLASGLFTKNEFYSGKSGWFWRRALKLARVPYCWAGYLPKLPKEERAVTRDE